MRKRYSGIRGRLKCQACASQEIDSIEECPGIALDGHAVVNTEK